jgi:hypothetical protein
MDGSNGDRLGQINQKGAGFGAKDPSIGDDGIGNNPLSSTLGLSSVFGVYLLGPMNWARPSRAEIGNKKQMTNEPRLGG